MSYEREVKCILQDYQQGQRIHCSEIYEVFAKRNGQITAADKDRILLNLHSLASVIWLKWDPQVDPSERRAREDWHFHDKLEAGDYVWNGPTIIASLKLAQEHSFYDDMAYRQAQSNEPLNSPRVVRSNEPLTVSTEAQRNAKMLSITPKVINNINDLLGIVLRVIHNCGTNKAYLYFDSDGIWQKITVEELSERQFDLTITSEAAKYLDNPKDWIGRVHDLYFKGRYVSFGNLCHLSQTFKLGFTPAQDLWDGLVSGNNKLMEKVLHDNPSHLYQSIAYGEVDQLIGKISRPRIDRDAGNTNRKTFDYIAVEVFLTGVFGDQTVMMIRKHKKEIINRVLRQVARSGSFTKYGIPVNMLQIKQATYNGNFISFTLELKPELQKMQMEQIAEVTKCFE